MHIYHIPHDLDIIIGALLNSKTSRLFFIYNARLWPLVNRYVYRSGVLAHSNDSTLVFPFCMCMPFCVTIQYPVSPFNMRVGLRAKDISKYSFIVCAKCGISDGISYDTLGDILSILRDSLLAIE